MEPTTYRRIMLGSLVALVAVLIGVWAINPLGDDAALPEPLEGVFPPPGDTVVRQTVVQIDLPVGYSIELEIDGIRIPQDEIGVIAATGRYTWGPGPGKLWEEWEGGEHTVTVRWDTGGRTDPGAYTWTFRVV